ncbi:FemAB family XrtA/PEP-CTERM system-associated protein [Methylovulum miyakonense]|uniref:FemAB family XrtA/PEP-CTERM system-associated protein n=1 Tax=Methylovulum miyakonense TaxID=645578 RepID=UPI0003828A37|nr:FemAB family XrtA/PEP-CTERM system-associated protein [Methylovulum miyakonense]
MIKTLHQADFGRWDEFVNNHPNGTFFHLSGWKTVIETAFGHKAHFLYTEHDGAITAILPLVHVNSLLFGNNLVSTAFCVYGGIIANNEASYDLLDAEACRLAKELGVDALEMRNRERKHPERPYKELYVTFRKQLEADAEKNMLAIPRKQRAMVRKGIEAGLVSTIDDDVGRLHLAYSESVRNLGTPVFSKKYFRTLKQVFGEQCEVLSIEHDGKLIASVMNFYFRDEVLPYYGGGTELARELKGNDFMYWEVMRRAVGKGVKIFDYGRSKIGTGSYSFKKNWGFTPEPLFYEYYLVKASEVPDINPLNPKYQFFIAAWKRLPLAVSQAVGPWLSRDLG